MPIIIGKNLLKIIQYGFFSFYIINSSYIILFHHQHEQQPEQQQHQPQIPQMPQQHFSLIINNNDNKLLSPSSTSSLPSIRKSKSILHNNNNETTSASASTSTTKSKSTSPTKSASTSTSITSTSITSTSTKEKKLKKNLHYWRYDDAGPKIEYAKTHFLSSIPNKHRLPISLLALLDDDGSPELESGKKGDDDNDNDNDSTSTSTSTSTSISNASSNFNSNFNSNLNKYSSNINNVWPNKLHLFETNPSIARLPIKYKQDKAWQKAFFDNNNNGDSNSNSNSNMRNMMPQYVSVYRVTHWNNCYDGNINLKMFGGSIVRETKYNIEQGNIPPQTDYIGISLLDINMNIVIDTTVNLRTIVTSSSSSKPKPKKKNPKKKKKKKNDRILFPMYNDYRLFNLNDNNGNDDQLYLTTMNHIAPIELSLLVTTATATATLLKQQQQPQPPIGYIEIPNAFNVNVVNNKTATASSNTTATSNTTAATASNTATATANTVSLQVFIRNYSSCPIGKTINKRKQSSKNLLYFQNNGNENDNTNSSSNKNTNTRTNTNTKLLVQPRWNPNEVLDNVDLNLICIPNKDTKTKYSINIDEQVKQAKEGYQTIEKLLYPSYSNNDLFVDDRGSACCTEIYINMNNMNNTNTNTNTTNENEEHDDQKQQRKQLLPNQKLKVAVVHPKTKYPGKNLPLGIKSNMYLSRFIAFLPEYPYTIIYKSGMFCLGYPTVDSNNSNGNGNGNGNGNDDNDNGSNQNPLTYMKMIPLEFGINNTNINETEAEAEAESTYYYNYNCPRIHFVTGMIDKVEIDKVGEVNNANNNVNNNNNNDGSVILSYGVSDCLSRFIEIKKSEIIRMLF